MISQIENLKENTTKRSLTKVELVKLEYYMNNFEISDLKTMEEIIAVSYPIDRKCRKCGSEIRFKDTYERTHPEYSPSLLRGFARRWLRVKAYILCENCDTTKKKKTSKGKGKGKRSPRKEIPVEELEQL